MAVKPTLALPAGTVTEAGDETALLLLPRFTANPPVAAAALSVTVQLSLPDPVMDALEQVRLVSTGIPVPLRLTIEELPVEELLFRINWPVSAPAKVGANVTVSEAV